MILFDSRCVIISDGRIPDLSKMGKTDVFNSVDVSIFIVTYSKILCKHTVKFIQRLRSYCLGYHFNSELKHPVILMPFSVFASCNNENKINRSSQFFDSCFNYKRTSKVYKCMYP